MATTANRQFSDIRRFWHCEDGAVTVDWVVLTAAICGLAIWLFTVITEEQFQAAAARINATIQAAASRD
ncbi:MAG: hypothetical protein U5N53_16565 [Mycobacterium sp.]|nr:hypothetical protein [Mycobacterium sp.]